MSIETCSTQEQGRSAGSDDAAPCSKTKTVGSATAQVDADSNADAHQASAEPVSVQSSASILLASLWSPLGSLLSSSRPNGTDKDVSNATESSHEDSKSEKKKDVNAHEDNKTNQTNSSRHSDSKDRNTENSPEPVYAPQDVPTYKALQKKRLTGTRTKQLLRAASRAYNDPPPEPELGMCCGSSCDPCVNDLWREERAVWRERWGDGRVEDIRGAEGRRKELEW